MVNVRSPRTLKLVLTTTGQPYNRTLVDTDIDDREFLSAFQEGVDLFFTHSAAAKSREFSVDLTIQEIPPDALYPEGVPGLGSRIDMKAHLIRFPKGALVLTTGNKKMSAVTRRAIKLGPSDVSKRDLAHEFGHLLGFDYAYVRGYSGEPTDTHGVVLIEWTGLTDDLMGNPDAGRVTEEMIDTLIGAYSKR